MRRIFTFIFICLLSIAAMSSAEAASRQDFAARLADSGKATLIIPENQTRWERYIYGNLALYLEELGINVDEVYGTYERSVVPTIFGKDVTMRYAGSPSRASQTVGQIVVGANYSSTPFGETIVVWSFDAADSSLWEFKLDNPPSRGNKLQALLRRKIIDSKMLADKKPSQSTVRRRPIAQGMWGGTAIELENGFLATNYHVVNGARSVWVYGLGGDFASPIEAKVVSVDRNADLAIIKVDDAEALKLMGHVPYSLRTDLSDVGEDVFVLGYPLISTMGDEIKLTTGVVSSHTGFQGDRSSYQTSAPIQPGNSGGPLFDGAGRLIGIVSSKHAGAENVSYAVKASLLSELISRTAPDALPQGAPMPKLSLPEKVKRMSPHVLMVKCSPYPGR